MIVVKTAKSKKDFKDFVKEKFMIGGKEDNELDLQEA